MYFSNAILKKPCKRISEGLSSSDFGKPDYKKAIQQHEQYAKTLKKLGLKIEVLPPDNIFPDSTFVEDTAVVTKRCAVITRPGAKTRLGEEKIIEKTLLNYFDELEHISAPGTLDGGDVMKTGNHFFIGLSARTNKHGASQLIDILNKYGYTGSMIENVKTLHLKSAVSYLEYNVLLLTKELKNQAEFKNFDHIIVPKNESYTANSIWINDTIIVPGGYNKTKQLVKNKGYKTISVDTSEFRKIDGGLSCLSLRF